MSFHSRFASDAPTTFWVAVAIIILLAAVFRFYGQNWDDGHYFHPDERFIAIVMDNRLGAPDLSNPRLLFDPANSPLNTRSDNDSGQPHEFAYGSLPFLTATILGSILGPLGKAELTSYANVGEFGRFLTAIVDLGTVTLVILFTRKAFSDLAALIAGMLTAASVVLIQLAHFFTVDTWVTFFTMAALYASLHVAQSFSLRWTLGAAALGGAALATKVSVGVLGIPIVVALVIGAAQVTSNRTEAATLIARRLALSAFPALGVFAVFEPYALWRPSPFISDIRNQWEIVNGRLDVPFTRQFVGTISGINEIENLVLWGIAPGFGFAALLATILGLYRAFTDRDVRYILLLSWIIPYFYVIASSEARFLRYSAPLVPPLAILAGHFLAYWWRRSEPVLRSRFVPGAAITAVIGVTVAWALAFMTVYAGTHPRVDASEWIYQNVAPGSTLTFEIWDDRLPVRLGSSTGEIFEHRSLDLYADRSNEDAVDFIADFLQDADYIILASQRLSHSIPKLPWRYPVQSEYYRLLENEQLGFELAYEATNYPGVGPVRINTLGADESFSVYDHPPVRIFRKVEELPRGEIDLRFANAAAQPRHPHRYPPEQHLLLGEPVQNRTVSPPPGWSSVATNFAPVAIMAWLTAIAAFGIAAFPLCVRLFPSFADLGAGFSVMLGLLGIGAVVWLIWSLEIASFSVGTTLVSAAVFAFIIWKGLRFTLANRTRVRGALKPIIASQGAFFAGFALFLVIRALNPDLWHPFFGGEKPMDTAYLNAIARTGDYPPHDPWFAGGVINYYYYGFVLLGMFWHLTGIPTDVAYQLSLATIAGLLASGLFSLGGALTQSILQTRSQGWLIGGGGLTVIAVMLTGNLYSGREAISNVTASTDFWASTRIVDFAINEFPYFTLLYGDVHAHLIAAPVLVLVLGLCYSWISSIHQASPEWAALWTATVGVVVGSIIVINTWDGPTAAVLLLAALLFSLFRRGGVSRERLVISIAAASSAVIFSALLFYRFHSDFVARTDGIERTSAGTSIADWAMHFGGLLVPIMVVAVMLLLGRLQAGHFKLSLLAYGAALAAGAFLAGIFATGARHDGIVILLTIGAALAAAGGLLALPANWTRTRSDRDIALIMISPFIAIAGTLTLIRPVAALSSLLIAAFIGLFVANRNRNAVLMIAICGASSAGLVLIADLVYIADHLQNSDWERMNTVFKLYFQSWTLIGVAAASAVIWLVYRAYLMHGTGTPSWRLNLQSKSFVMVVALASAVFLALAWFAYPITATTDRLAQRMDSSPERMTLSGHQWMSGGTLANQAGDEIDFSGDYEAVQWFRSKVSGNPVILEASIGPYRGGGSRFSSATGMPTVLGWESHQSQQRGSPEVAVRAREVRELYVTDDIERKRYLLRKYAVDFVVVGDVERFTTVGTARDNQEPEYYSSPSGLDAFNAMLSDDLEIAFQSHGTIVYRVLPFPNASDHK